jgi:hypothetical protein
MDLFTNAFGIHERALQVRSQRLEVLASNIANAVQGGLREIGEEADNVADVDHETRVFHDVVLGGPA